MFKVNNVVYCLPIDLDTKIKNTYTYMTRRSKGEIGRDRTLDKYSGMEVLSKEDFIKWAKRSKKLKQLYKAWVDSGYLYKLQPSIDRINSDKGYTKSNIRWLTQSENSARSSKPKQLVLNFDTPITRLTLAVG